MSFAKRARDNYFTLNGRSSADWGIVASKDNGFDAPERDVSAIEVPGRNGELHIDNGRWRNIDVTYNDCVIENDFTERFGDFRAYCARQRGYQRLEDTFHPDEYRLADMTQGIKVSSVGTRYNAGRFDLTFNCKPQRLLKSGEDPIIFIAPSSNMSTDTYTSPERGSDLQRIGVRVASFSTSGTVTITRHLSDSIASHTTSDSITISDYEIHWFDGIPTYDQWRLVITGGSGDSFDDIRVEITQGYALINGESVSLAGSIIARQHTITNPTGFRCNPLIKVIGGGLPITYITTGETLDDGEQWSMTWNLDSSINPDEFFVDCENEYIYYYDDGVRKNLTNYITIVHFNENGDEVPTSFPAMGEEHTTIYFGRNAGTVLLYPHWFTI